MRVAIYTRVSTEEQAAEEKLSLTDQEEVCRAWCANKGYLVVGVYSDPGVSGGTTERPGLQAALSAARGDEYDVLLAKCMDRLTRDTDHGGYLATILSTNNVSIRLVDEEFDETPIGKLMRTISTWRGEEEREKFRKRGLVGRKGRAKAGKSNAPTQAYGYSREATYDAETGKLLTEKLVVDEFEGAWVRKVFDLYLLEGMAIRQIAFVLNEAGVPTRRKPSAKCSGRWSAEPVRRILTREAYTGTGWQNVRETVKKNGKKKHFKIRPREEWLEIAFPPIIDIATFEATQEKIKQNKPWRRPAPGRSSRHLLQGLVFCSECGNKLLSHTGGGKERQRLGYICQTQLRRGTDCRKPMWLKAVDLEGPVWTRIAEACKNPDLWVEASEAHDEVTGELETNAGRLLEDVRSKRGKALEERQRLVRSVATGTLSGSDRDVKALMGEYDERIAAWDHELERLEVRTGQRRRQAVEREQAEALAKAIGAKVDRLSFEQRSELLRAMVRRIWVDREGSISIEAGIPYLEQGEAVDPISPLISEKSTPCQTARVPEDAHGLRDAVGMSGSSPDRWFRTAPTF